MELMLFCCANSCTIDAVTNSASIFNMIEEINSPIYPAAVANFTVFALLSRKPSETQIQTIRLRVFRDAAKKPVLDAPMTIDFQSHMRARAIGNLQGMTIEGPGILRVELGKGNTILGTWKVSVNQIGQPTLVPPSKKASSATSSTAISSRKKQKRRKKR